MRKTAFIVFVMLAVLGAAACTDNTTGPIANSCGLAGKASTNTAANINAGFGVHPHVAQDWTYMALHLTRF